MRDGIFIGWGKTWSGGAGRHDYSTSRFSVNRLPRRGAFLNITDAWPFSRQPVRWRPIENFIRPNLFPRKIVQFLLFHNKFPRFGSVYDHTDQALVGALIQPESPTGNQAGGTIGRPTGRRSRIR